MTRPRPGIGSELLPVGLILVCLAGTWSLVVAMHHRGASSRHESTAPAVAPSPSPEPSKAQAPTPVAAAPPPAPAEPPAPKPAPAPPGPPPEDPTEKALAKLALAQTEQLLEAQLADRKAEALEKARQAAVAEAQRRRRRESLIRTQIDSLTEQATRLEAAMDEIALERDALARERDAARAALNKARTRSSYAVLPNKAQNGTWRRPIIIECHNGEATLQPNGPSFSLLDLSSIISVRSSPLVAAVAREVVRAQALSTPDGAPVVPYIFFVIRPDGIRPYYNSRAQLEPLGIAFGYELVDQNLEIDYPDLDNLDEWDGSIPERPRQPASRRSDNGATADQPWPASTPRGGGSRASDDPADTFVWPARPTAGGSGRGGVSEGTPGFPDLPRRGRAGRGGSTDDPIAGGPSTPARNGLGRGGSGVDPLPLGGPGLDPDNPYDTPGLPGLLPGHHGGGSAPPFGAPSGSSGRSPGDPGGGEAPTPDRTPGLAPGQSPGNLVSGDSPPTGQGPKLIPVSPDGLPSLEEPGTSGGTSGRPSTGPIRGRWRVAGRDRVLTQGNGNDGPSGPPPSQDRARLVPGGEPGSPNAGRSGSGNVGPNPNPGAAPTLAGIGSFDPNQGAPPPLSQLARLAGATGAASAAGAAGQPSKLQSGASPFGIPVPLPNQVAGGMGSEDGAEAGEQGSQSPSQEPGLRARSSRKGPLTVDVPFELVVACEPGGVVIHPGGYRLSAKALKGKDGLLLKRLQTIVQTRRQVDPTIHPRPSIRFLVEPGGSETYRDARRQTMLSGMDWPVALQVSDSDILGNNASREPF